MGAPEATIVVATRDRAALLRRLLDGLRRQTAAARRFEVVVVDDGSADATPAVLEEERARGELDLRVVRRAASGGPAVARNAGWRLASAPLVVFTDDDCVPVPGWLAALLAAAAPDTVVQGPTLPDPGQAQDLGPFAKTVRIEGPSPHFETCNIAYPRELLERVGGFDERFPAAAGEDGDLGWRALRAGAGRAFAPEALVHHAVHAGTPATGLRAALMAEHGVQSYKRNPELRALLAHGVFYDRSHRLLLQALLAGALARRRPAAAVLAAPYALHLLRRCRAASASPAAAPYFALYDLVQVGATVRGAVRHRFPVI